MGSLALLSLGAMRHPKSSGRGPAPLGTRNYRSCSFLVARVAFRPYGGCRSRSLVVQKVRGPPLRSIVQPLFSCQRVSKNRSPAVSSLRLRPPALTPSKSSWLTMLFRLNSSQGPHAMSRKTVTPVFFPHSSILRLRRCRNICIA